MPQLPSFFLRLPLLLGPLLVTPAGAYAAALDEVVTEFLGGSVHAGLPAGFPAVALPEGLQLRVVGTLAVGNIEQVLLEAPDTSAASAALRAAYVAAGWTDLSTNSVIVMLCHASHGSLQILPASRATGRLRVLRSHDNLFAGDPRGESCGQPSTLTSQSWYSWILELVPALAVPPQTKLPPVGVTPAPRPGLVAGQSSGNGLLELTVSVGQENVIEVPSINIAGLDAHFSARLAEQGWQRDSGGIGSDSATSVWFKPASVTPAGTTEAQDVMLGGTLTLQHRDGDHYYVSFNLNGVVEVPLAGGGSTQFIRDIVPSGCAPLNDPQIGIRGIPVTGSRICRP